MQEGIQLLGIVIGAVVALVASVWTFVYQFGRLRGELPERIREAAGECYEKLEKRQDKTEKRVTRLEKIHKKELIAIGGLNE